MLNIKKKTNKTPIGKVDKNTIFTQMMIANCSQQNSHKGETES